MPFCLLLTTDSEMLHGLPEATGVCSRMSHDLGCPLVRVKWKAMA